MKNRYNVLLLVALSGFSVVFGDVTREPRSDAPQNSAIVGPSITCNEEIRPLLLALKNNIGFCCAELQQDFNETFSLLFDIKNSITSCCETIEQTFNGTFTLLADIESTITACCAEFNNQFQQTFTSIATGFNGSFTALFDFNTTLTQCCELIERNFQGTFTALDEVVLTCTAPSPCSSISITGPTTISVSGYYCLANEINGLITINADNVTLDFDGNSLVGTGVGSGIGLVVNAGTNRVIRNGKIVNFEAGIFCDSSVETVIENLIIDTCLNEGIRINDCDVTLLNLLMIQNVTGDGIHFFGVNSNLIVQKITITNTQQGVVFDDASNGLIEDCNVFDSGFASSGAFVIVNGTYLQFNNCFVKNYVTTDGAAFLLHTNNNNIIFKGCIAQNISAPSAVIAGFSCRNPMATIQFLNCSALNIAGTMEAHGFLLSGTAMIVDHCLAKACVSAPGNGAGFTINAEDTSLSDCEAYNCDIGFSQPSSLIAGPLCAYCRAAYNSIGFSIGGGVPIIGNSVAFKNTIGFSLPLAGSQLYRCFATQNITDYINAPNVQNANTQVDNTAAGLTGPFAGGNLFI
jgi:hypothetical protein